MTCLPLVTLRAAPRQQVLQEQEQDQEQVVLLLLLITAILCLQYSYGRPQVRQRF